MTIIKTKIQSTKSINLPKVLKKDIKKNNYDKVKWEINVINNQIRIQFLKSDINQNHDYKKEGNNLVFYRNIYTQASIKIPVKAFEVLHCNVGDTIELKVQDRYIMYHQEKDLE